MGIISWFTNCRAILVNNQYFRLLICSIIKSRAQVNILIGFVVLAWIIAPSAYYSNLWDAKNMPIVSMRVFTPDGYVYNISAVLNSELRLNETAYKQYGRSSFILISRFLNIFR